MGKSRLQRYRETKRCRDSEVADLICYNGVGMAIAYVRNDGTVKLNPAVMDQDGAVRLTEWLKRWTGE